ncbi:nuclear transport factor 2 family protein [Streptomyces specialis]|uniref:nuclear transport factor 2 family protein n=1 Tax=Streptomyces specialis TaxID=498367 RepID=UPI00073F72F3|nr:nuclear transport factor 2 family protein [Streptomyces specialis]
MVRTLRKNALLVTALLLALVAAIGATGATFSWYDASHDETADFAKARDDALAAARQGVQNLNTLDHADFDAGMDLWLDSTTGDLHEQLEEGRDAFAEQVGQAESVTTAEVVSAAVTELDERAGRAGVIVAVRITVTLPDEEPDTKTSRMLGELTRTSEGWKISGLDQAPVG